jgi:hypothetical protein
MADAYTLQARRVPVAAVVVPPFVLAASSAVTTAGFGIGSGLVLMVAAAIAGQLGRDRGKRLEAGLWESWGGAPTLQRVRWRTAANAGRVERLHARIEAIIGEALPTAAEEAAEPGAADDRYDEASARVRALTRDRERFPLLFAENVNYGMRRNMLGLKWIAVVVAVLTIVGGGLLLWLGGGALATNAGRYAPGIAVGLVALAFWLFVVRPAWVRLTAEAYAVQFVGAIDILAADHAAATSDSNRPPRGGL